MSIDGGRRWAVVAAAGAGTLVALVAAVLVVNRQSAAPGEQQPPPSARAAADPRTLVVDDGDLVEASGQVLVAPGKPARLCAPAPVPAIGRPGNQPPTCALGVDVTGVDPAKLTGAGVVAGVTTGQARLRGTWRDGRLHVTEQGPPKPPAPVGFDDTVPCGPPKGGWKPGGGADSNAMHQYIYEQHPDRFRPLRIAYPDGPPTGATTGPQPTEVTVVEVVAGDAAGEEQRLRKLFDGNLCVVAAPGRPSIARQEQLREQVSAGLDPLMSDPASGIWSVGGDDVSTVELMMLTPRLYEQLNAIGFDLLRVEPWLRPTVG